MSESPYVFEVTRENFIAAVMEKSRQVPVLVDFWAAWCGPCQMQLPILLKLAEEYQGKFLLGKLDTERERELTREFQIRSIPTMKLFKDGEIVEDILGAQTESTLREILQRHIPRQSDAGRLAAQQAYRQGDIGKALQLLRETMRADPDNHQAKLDLAHIALEQGELEEPEALLATLPQETADSPDGMALRARLEFARIARQAPDPDSLQRTIREDGNNLEAKYQLAAKQVPGGEYEAALELLLEILAADRNFRDDGARKALLSLFQVMGEQHELTNRYRRKMFNLLH